MRGRACACQLLACLLLLCAALVAERRVVQLLPHGGQLVNHVEQLQSGRRQAWRGVRGGAGRGRSTNVADLSGFSAFAAKKKATDMSQASECTATSSSHL